MNYFMDVNIEVLLYLITRTRIIIVKKKSFNSFDTEQSDRISYSILHTENRKTDHPVRKFIFKCQLITV